MLLMTDRMWKAFCGTMIPSRVLMGVQMVIYGAAYWYVEKGQYFYQRLIDGPFGFMWIVVLVGCGMWLVTSAVAEGWVRLKAQTIRRRVELPTAVVAYGRTRFFCYFFVVSLWAALCFNSWGDGVPKMMDLFAPVYVVFLTWAAVNDAYQRRKARSRHVSVLGK